MKNNNSNILIMENEIMDWLLPAVIDSCSLHSSATV